jgi:hypothetical protein
MSRAASVSTRRAATEHGRIVLLMHGLEATVIGVAAIGHELACDR